MLTITNVRAVQPETPAAPRDWRTLVGQILVAVDTDKGLTGYGVGGGGPVGAYVVTRLLRDLLLGQSPLAVERHWERLFRATTPYGRKGLAIMALSGVDLALWDLRAKAEGVPVARLLASDPLRDVPCYASLGADPADSVEQGFDAVKLHLPAAETAAQKQAIIDKVARARAVLGPARRLMTDAFLHWDLPTSLEFAREFQRFNVEWLEEPLLPDDVAGYQTLMRESPIPIAGGEHEYTAYGFADVIERKMHAILQPDVTWCGGLTELVKIYRHAAAAGLRVCQHRGAEVWGLHAIAAFEHSDPLAEAGRPWMSWVHDQPPITGGRIAVPQTPGFGIRIDESALP